MHNLDIMIRNLAIGVAILVMVPLAIAIGVDIVNPEPQKSDFTVTTSSDSWFSKEKKENIDQIAYDDAFTAYRKKYFYISVTLGIASIIAGALIQIPFIGVGFILGGGISTTIGYWSYWKMIPNYLKLISLLFSILLLVFLGYRLARRKA